MKTKILFIGMILALIVTSCSKDNANTNTTSITADEALVNAKLDLMNDDVSKVVEDQFDVSMANSTAKTTQTDLSVLPVCVTITRVPAFGTVVAPGTLITKTIDFGSTGCAMPNGNSLKGKIIITFTYQPTATSHIINYEFVDFYHNNIKINGNKTCTRTMSVATAASPSHPIVVMEINMTATFPNGKTYTRIGTRTREIIEGFATPSWTDNLYQITGNWTTTFENTTVQTSTITTPLIIKMSCPNIVKGIIAFTRNSHNATLDYGDGTCNNQAIFTVDGVPHTITLN